MCQGALTQLQKNQIHRPNAPRLHQLSARAAAQQQKRGQAHRHLAEYHALQGNLTTAIQHLQQALSQPDLTTFERIRIQARLETLQTTADRAIP